MTDQRLRDLERRWHETGLVEDEAAYLLERVRAGDLGGEMLRLAAYCGHAGAACAAKHCGMRAAAHEDPCAPLALTPDDQGSVALRRWVLGITEFGQLAFARAVLSCTREAIAWNHAPDLARLNDCIESVDRWALDPSTETKADVGARVPSREVVGLDIRGTNIDVVVALVRCTEPDWKPVGVALECATESLAAELHLRISEVGGLAAVQGNRLHLFDVGLRWLSIRRDLQAAGLEVNEIFPAVSTLLGVSLAGSNGRSRAVRSRLEKELGHWALRLCP